MLRLEFQLCGAGWAELTVVSDERTLTHGVSDTTDVLGDLGAALADLATGGDRAEILVLDDDGDQHRWVLERAGHDGLHLEIFHSEGCTELEPGRPQRLVFTAHGSLQGAARSWADCLAAIARTHGIAGYETMWGAHPFPREPLETLQRRYGSLR
jgi:hypothetical protein